MLFENLAPTRLAALWVTVAVLVAGAVIGSRGINRWARPPADFVLVCRDSVPPIPPPEAGLAPRIAALDFMVACTERMEVQYIAKGELAYEVSLGLIALATFGICVSAVATRRFLASSKRRNRGSTQDPLS